MNQNDTTTKRTINLIDKENDGMEENDISDSSSTLQTDLEVDSSPKPSHHKNMTKTYTIILLLLFVITIVEYIFSTYLDIENRIKLLILLGFALIKAVAIVAYFMHVKFDKHRYLIIALTFLFPLAISLPIAFFPTFG